MGDGFPYAVASDEAVRAGAWTTDLGAGLGGLPEWLPNWDVSQTLDVLRSVEVDTDQIASDTGLAPDAQLALTVTFASAFDDLGTRVELDRPGATAAFELRVRVPGRHSRERSF